MGVHRRDLKKEEEEIRNSTEIGCFSNETGRCLSKQKNRKLVTKNIDRNNK
jgi:hypothetical protein